jgi:cyclase
MRRAVALFVIIGVGATSMAVRAWQQPGAGAEKKIEVEKLQDNLFVLRGGGGNTAVFVRSEGVTVVDTKLPGWGQPILAAIRNLTDKPVTTIINTHTHGDHVSGNVEFPEPVEVVVHENTQANMKKMASPFGQPGANIFEEHKGRGTPDRTFTDQLTLGSGADRVELRYFGRGHTNGDAIVVFPAHRTAHMGDLFPSKQLPLMDMNNGGSGVAYPETLKKAHAGLTDVQTIITGHGPQMTPDDLQQFAGFVASFVDAVRAGKKAGQTPEEIGKNFKAADGFSVQPKWLEIAVQGVYKEIQ